MKKSTKVKKVRKEKDEFNVLDNAYLKAFIALIIFTISMFLFAKTTNIVENVIETHSINSKIDYKVYLFENPSFNEETAHSFARFSLSVQ